MSDRQPNEDYQAAEELADATGEPESKFEPPEDVEYPDPDGLDADEAYIHHCPNCGCRTLDGQGEFTRDSAVMRPGEGMIEYVEHWYRMHCPDCTQVFAMLESVEEVAPATEDDDDE